MDRSDASARGPTVNRSSGCREVLYRDHDGQLILLVDGRRVRDDWMAARVG
jgi:hypothetical protein